MASGGLSSEDFPSGNLLPEEAGRWGAGSVIANSRLRAPKLDGSMHTPFLDPERCTCAGPHTCIAEKGYMHGNISEVPADFLATHHYVEMLSWDHGRCNRLHDGLLSCNVPDSSLVWAAELLRDQTALL